MHDTTAIIAPRNLTPAAVGKNSNLRYGELYRRYPTVDYLRRGARRRLPHFAFEYGDGGSGKDDAGIKRNWTALDAVELVPRYGIVPSLPSCDIELFGRRYAAPIGIAPMGGPAIVWPGADRHLARAAQKARVPYVLGMAGGATIEEIAEIAPDVCWFQLYRAANNDHAIGFDLVQRAAATACSALVLTLDVPVRTTRAREVVVGLGGAFQPDLKMLAQMAMSPGWTMALWRNGIPRFASLRSYAGENPSINEVISFAKREMGGAFTWGEVAKYRDRWNKTLIVKGILHPQDAEKAISLGVDGLFVSNHGGRQIEALPAAIDALPAIVKQAGKRVTVMMDSGIRGGTDVVRAYALGASAAFAGKAFLWGLGALGEEGPGHVIDLLIEETQAALGQLGARKPDDARSAVIRHNGALQF
ncbi:MAG: alpha-hydroxy acid oxidase [Xanthobacteraceae bacterium]|jgi:(S)-mandelate dehydrogenase